jgi:anti-anti-sigma regulatory factor
VLVRVTDEAQRRGIALTITPAPPEVQRVFEVSGLADVLPFS